MHDCGKMAFHFVFLCRKTIRTGEIRRPIRRLGAALHIPCSLNRAIASLDETRPFARAVAMQKLLEGTKKGYYSSGQKSAPEEGHLQSLNGRRFSSVRTAANPDFRAPARFPSRLLPCVPSIYVPRLPNSCRLPYRVQ